MQTETSPLKIERDALGAVYYWIDNSALDLGRIDYSDLYETYMTPIEGQLFEDCTQLFIEVTAFRAYLSKNIQLLG